MLWFGVQRSGFSVLFLLLFLIASGCAARHPLGQWAGPTTPCAVVIADWSYDGRPGWKITTDHYTIYTTIQREDTRAMLPQVMEGCLGQYLQLVPGVSVSSRSMDCYVFYERDEWSKFTRQVTGSSAEIFLQIRRGGYALQDRFVAWFIGPLSTASVASHEGWHQFLARHFKCRLPPFLDEGLACTFEGVDFANDLPRWNTAINRIRVQALRKTMEESGLFPLEQLVTMDAGQVVDKTSERIDAFYAQSWAFAKFMREAEGGRYRPALEHWLTESAQGTPFDPFAASAGQHPPVLPWLRSRAAVKPIIEHYMGMPFAQIDSAYQAYLHKIAFEEFGLQWGLN